MAINTTRSVAKASTALGDKVKYTEANMDKLLKAAEVKGNVKRIQVPIIQTPGDRDDVVFIGLNGQRFYFQRGTSVAMPEPLLKIAVSCGIVDKAYIPKETTKAAAAKE